MFEKVERGCEISPACNANFHFQVAMWIMRFLRGSSDKAPRTDKDTYIKKATQKPDAAEKYTTSECAEHVLQLGESTDRNNGGWCCSIAEVESLSQTPATEDN